MRCSECGSISACRLPGQAELDEFYRTFNQNYAGGGRKEGRSERQDTYAARYLQLVNTYARGTSLVDVGSSTNPFPNRAKSAGYDVTVVDYVKPAGLAEGIRFVPGSLDSPGDLAGRFGSSFDVVTAFAVLEHCCYPQKAATALSNLCKPRGVIILTTPEIGEFADAYAPGRSGWFYPPEHLNLVSRKAVIRLFASAGCSLIASAKFELNRARWIARYGLGLAEGVAGWTLKKAAPETWERVRNERVALNQGIAQYILEKA